MKSAKPALWMLVSYFSVFGEIISELSYFKPWQEVALKSIPGEKTLDPKTRSGLQWRFEPALEFSNAFQSYIVDAKSLEITRELDGIKAMTVGLWVYSKRQGEQVFFCRGVPVFAPAGERIFPPNRNFVSFCIGTDERGFFYGSIHGNGKMPFPHVTLSEVQINIWNQLVVVKDAEGYQKFYHNGRLVRTDRQSFSGGYVRTFRETTAGLTEPIRFAMPMSGKIGEAWIHARELSAGEVAADYRDKAARYIPSRDVAAPLLREMDARPSAGLWAEMPSEKNWRSQRERLLERAVQRLGTVPVEKVPLDPQTISETDCGTYLRRKVTIAVQPEDRMPAYLMIPKNQEGRMSAIICMYGTTSGAGKETTVGLSGREPGSKPEPNLNFGVHFVEAGFVVLAPDYLRDGERIKPGERPYESTSFKKKFPDWSIGGKDAWDNARAVDYLQTLEFVDPRKIGMTGHSYGGGGTITAAALEPRIKVAVASGPVSSADYHELTSLLAPRPLLVGQAVGERRPGEENIHAAVSQVYRALGQADRIKYVWHAGDHDYAPELQDAAVEWFQRWFAVLR